MCIQFYCIVLGQCHSATKRRGLLPFGDHFLDEIFVQNFKWRVSQRGADLSYILIPILLLSLKNWLSYTARHIVYALLFAVQIPPNHVFIMRVYTIILYCTCSMSQRCKKTRVTSLRRPFSRRNICPKFKMTGVSERVRPQLYVDTNFVTVSQKLAELYSSAYCLCFTFCRSNPSQPCIHNACVYNHIVLYLLNVTALQKDEGYFPSATVF